MQLIELGEREIVRRLIAPRVSGLGDDCAIVSLGGMDSLVTTTDPVPVPAANVIAGDADPYWAGWLLVTINASDIAASGAEPVGFMAAFEAPAEMQETDFIRLLDGVEDSCKHHNIPYVGGNIKEAPRFAATGSAFGICKGRPAITRTGAQVGHVIALVGVRPRFWADALSVISGRSVDRDSPLFRPRAAVPIMGMLAAQGFVAAAIDNSDGLLPSAEQLAERSGVCIELDVTILREIGAGCDAGVDPARLVLGWGDWNILCAINPDNIKKCRQVAASCGFSVEPIGACVGGNGVYLKGAQGIIHAPRLESERFSRDSWFLEGIEGYIDRLKGLKLPD